MSNFYIDDDNCRIIGDVERDACGDLKVNNLKVRMFIGCKYVHMVPQEADDRAFLIERLFEGYELEQAERSES